MTKLDLIEENLLLKVENYLVALDCYHGMAEELNKSISGMIEESFEWLKDDEKEAPEQLALENMNKYKGC